jgi:hypothetical protein
MVMERAMDVATVMPVQERPRGSTYYYYTSAQGEAAQLTMLQRYLSLKPAVAFGLTVLSSWTGISLTVSAAFLNGGPTTLVWGTILAGVGTLAIAASLGELASMYVAGDSLGPGGFCCRPSRIPSRREEEPLSLPTNPFFSLRGL